MSDSRYEGYKASKNNKTIKTGYKTEIADNMVISYLSLRRSIGFAGILLPIILILGSSVNEANILPSISHYFHSSMKIIFVGFIFAISSFLYSYNGSRQFDKYLCKIASVCSLLVAIIPTQNDLFVLEKGKYYSTDQLSGFLCPSIEKSNHMDLCHLFFAFLFFLLLSILVLFSFIKDENDSLNKSKIRVIIYYICGIGMLLSILLIGINFKFDIFSSTAPTTFILETLALELFGLAWIIKADIPILTFNRQA